MILGRYLGWGFVFVACAVIVRDGIAWADIHHLAPLSLGGLWNDLSAASFRSARDRLDQTTPWLWSAALRPVLLLWAAPAFAICGMLLLWTCRRTPQRRFR
jgi:hypothetical protein